METLSLIYQGWIHQNVLEDYLKEFWLMARTYKLVGLAKLVASASAKMLKDLDTTIDDKTTADSSKKPNEMHLADTHGSIEDVPTKAQTAPPYPEPQLQDSEARALSVLPSHSPKWVRIVNKLDKLGWLPTDLNSIPLSFRFVLDVFNADQAKYLNTAQVHVIYSSHHRLPRNLLATQVANLFNNWQVRCILERGFQCGGQMLPHRVESFLAGEAPPAPLSQLRRSETGSIPICSSFNQNIPSAFVEGGLSGRQRTYLWVAYNHVRHLNPPAPMIHTWVANLFNYWHILMVKEGQADGLGGQILPSYVADFLKEESALS